MAALCCIAPAQGNGADVIVGQLPSLNNYGPANGHHAYSVATTSCNIGTVPLQWIASTNQHPVISQQMYRIRDGVFQQVGMSWLKHGFFALQGSLCSPCNPHPNGTALGVGCSDPYSAGRNGSQGSLGPRNEINAATGVYTYPPTYGAVISDTTSSRLRVPSALVANQPASARFYVEAQYVAQDDAAAGNHNNNASYRELNASASGSMNLNGATIQQEPAIMAWPNVDPGVTVVTYDVPNDGRFYLGTNVINVGGGVNRYVMALHNLNSDLAASGISIAMPSGATVTNLQFIDADYHSGELYGSTDWNGSFGGGAVSWSSPDTFAANANGAALRWGSCHTFVFESDMAPGDVTVTHFKNNQTFTFGSPPPPPQPDYMTNQPAASFDANGLTNNGFTSAIQVTLNFGDTATVNYSSNVSAGGSLQDIFYQTGNAHPVSGAGTLLPDGQIVNLDMSQPMTQLWNWQPTSNGSFPFTAPAAPLDVVAQMAVTDATSVTGFHVSAAIEADVVACAAAVVPHSLGDDDSIVITLGAGGMHDCIANVALYGTTYTDLHINSNGSVSANAGTGDFSASVSEFLSEMPRVACNWSDLDPTSGGTIQSVSAPGSLSVQFANIPEWGSSPLLSVDVIFAANGDITIGNHSAGGGWSTSTVVGFSPGGNASGNSVAWSSLVGGTTGFTANEAVYEYVSGGAPSGFTSITMDTGNNMTVN